jgi:hypothetical protein
LKDVLSAGHIGSKSSGSRLTRCTLGVRPGSIEDSLASVYVQAWTAAATICRVGLIYQNSTHTLLPENVIAAAAAFVLVGDVWPDNGVVEY